MLDLHNHMLPGLDDGPSDWEESLAMARIAWEDGVKGVVCTPHYLPGGYENTRPVVVRAVEELRRRLLENNIPLHVFLGGELRLDTDMPRRIASWELPSINDTGTVALIELPGDSVLRNREEFLWDLQSRGITPVLAHPERIGCFQRDPMSLFNLVHMGALVQLTAASLLGRFGGEAKKTAIFLMEHRLAHVVATDAHGARLRRPKLSEAYKLVKKMWGEKMANQTMMEIPMQILSGGPVTPLFEPVKERGKRFFSFSLLRRFL